MVARLTEGLRAESLAALPEWTHDPERDAITRRFTFKDFNEAFGTLYPDENFDTVGGMVIHHLGRLPKRNEVLSIGDLRFQILRADSRRVHTLLVDRQRAQPTEAEP